MRKALAGESIARNKYSFYAMHARECNDPELAEMFERLSKNEMIHAKAWFQYLYQQNASVNEDILTAAEGEYAEWKNMYPEFAVQARKDGFDEIAAMFEQVARIESDHEMQLMQAYMKRSAKNKGAEAMAGMEMKTVQGYRCQFCGAVFEECPDVCSVCNAIGSFDSCTYKKRV